MAEYGAELWRALLVAALLTTVAPTSVAAREFRAADTQNEDYPTAQALNYLGGLVEQRSGGRPKLGEEKETIEQTRVGAIDINRTNVALLGGFVPAINVLAMPFLFRSTEHLQRVLDGPIGQEMLKSFEPYGLVGLAFYDSGVRAIGDENNWPSLITSDHYKYASFYARTEHAMSPEVLVMSLKAWKGLSDEDQQIFREAAAASSRFMRQKWRDLEQRSREEAEEAGVTVIIDLDRRPFESAMAPIYEKAERDPATAALIDRIRKTE